MHKGIVNSCHNEDVRAFAEIKACQVIRLDRHCCVTFDFNIFTFAPPILA